MPTPADFPSRWFPLRFTKKGSEAEKYYNTKVRFFGCDAGRQSYKTELAKRRLVMSLIEPKPWEDPRYFFGAPTQAQAKFIAWEDLKRLVPKRWIRDPENDIKESELMIRTGFGAELHVVGMDKPHRIEGKAWDGGILDECADLRWKEAELTILPMLGPREGWLGRIGVPKRNGIGAAKFQEFCEKARKSKDPETAAYSWPSSDVMTNKQLKWYQDNWDVKDYAEQYGGQWMEGGGGRFYAFHKANKRACTFDPSAPMIVGCDFNVNPMAWVLGHPRDNCTYIEWFDEIWKRDTNTQETLDELWDKYGEKTHGTIAFYGDATSKNRHTSQTRASQSDYLQILNDKRFKKKGATVHFPKENPARSDRFASCNAVLKSASGNVRCFFDERMEHTLIDITGMGHESSKDIGHASDAWGYPTFMLFPIIDDPGIQKVVSTGPRKKASANREVTTVPRTSRNRKRRSSQGSFRRERR